MRVVLAPCEAESVAVGLFIASGSRHETAKTAGISHFIEHMLFKGTPTRRPVDITRAIEGRGGNFNACTGEESTCYYAHLPCEYLPEAVDILSDMYLRATIPSDEFVREKQVIVEEIRMYADEPDSVAMENLQRALFPKSTLGAPVAGTPDSLKPMRPADLKRYIKTHYLPPNTIVVIVGNFDETKAIKLVEKAMVGRDVLGTPRRPPPGRPTR
ncbi:MAG: insulinase family protein [bacterium]|nr:insulinase family protein [Candidatus Colisoma equi]